MRAEVSGIVPLDELEQSHVNEVLEWIDSGAEIFRRQKPATPPVHLVSYFAIVDMSAGGHILLVDHKNAQLWLPAGGHVEPDEHPRVTVQREAAEELGLAVSTVGAPLMITRTGTVGLTAGHVDVSLWYVLHACREQALTFDASEFNGIKWFAFAEVPLERSDPYMRRFLRKLLASSPSGVGRSKDPALTKVMQRHEGGVGTPP